MKFRISVVLLVPAVAALVGCGDDKDGGAGSAKPAAAAQSQINEREFPNTQWIHGKWETSWEGSDRTKFNLRLLLNSSQNFGVLMTCIPVSGETLSVSSLVRGEVRIYNDSIRTINGVSHASGRLAIYDDLKKVVKGKDGKSECAFNLKFTPKLDLEQEAGNSLRIDGFAPNSNFSRVLDNQKAR